MARTDDDREFRLRPPKPRVARNEGAEWSSGFRLHKHYARISRKASNRAPGGKGKGPRPYHQRCAVRVTYLKNKVRGQWKAHGRYLARESAAFEDNTKPVGFNRETAGRRYRESALRAARQSRRSGDVWRRARRHAGFGGPWHELTTTVSSGYDRQSLALPGTKVPHGRADSGFSCTMPGAAERRATARQAEKGKARVRTISAARSG